MLRHRRRRGSEIATRLLYSARTLEDVIYRTELDQPEKGLEVVQTLTRAQPADWSGYARRVDQELLREVAWPARRAAARVRLRADHLRRGRGVCLVTLGYPPTRVKTERFGATGGR